MGIVDVLLLSVALSMDAAAVSMTNGMTHSKAGWKQSVLPAFFFGLFQAAMPLIGYYATEFISGAFQELFEKCAAWIAFAILAAIGGKMAFDGIKEAKEAKNGDGESAENAIKDLSLKTVLVQALATSIDALAVGISLKMTAIEEGLFPAIGFTAAIIGAVTFLLSAAATGVGKKAGDKLSNKAEIAGGAVLIAIALKTLISSFL